MLTSTWGSRLCAVGFVGVVALMSGAPTAWGDNSILCQAGEVVVNGQCHAPPNQASDHPANAGGSGSGSGGHAGGHGH